MSISTRHEIVTQLKLIEDFQTVGGAVDHEAVKKSAVRTPSAYVLLMRDEANPNKGMNKVLQNVTEHYAIYIIVDNKRQISGDDSMELVITLKEKVKKKLLGWRPTLAYSGMEYQGGELIEVNERLLWTSVFSCYKNMTS